MPFVIPITSLLSPKVNFAQVPGVELLPGFIPFSSPGAITNAIFFHDTGNERFYTATSNYFNKGDKEMRSPGEAIFVQQTDLPMHLFGRKQLMHNINYYD